MIPFSKLSHTMEVPLLVQSTWSRQATFPEKPIHSDKTSLGVMVSQTKVHTTLAND